ncbi:metallophosphoesterase [Sphingobacterium sp.]|uniref:metallophosphoesterase n=1 Tax=Sphingobacterium sp. TaxID=341027 RepID=UPI002898A7F9|nr:metallophosphoesterase [Sphingobacterium sp.]
MRLRRLTVWKSNPIRANIVWWSFSILSYLSMFLNLFFKWSSFASACFVFFPLSLLIAKVIILFFIGIDAIVLVFRIICRRFIKAKPRSDLEEHVLPIKRSDFIVKSGLLLASVPLVALTRGFAFNLYDYQVKHIDLILPNLPKSFDGITIAQISDIHAGSLYHPTDVKRGVDMLLAQKPDIIFFTGDLVNDFASEMEDYLSIFNKIKAPLGTFSILGNHDYGEYHFNRQYFFDQNQLTKAQNLANLKAIHQQLGWQLLLNESRELVLNNEKITIIGVENWGVNNPNNYGDIDLSMSKVDKSSPVNLMLSHDPSHWRAEIIPKYPNVDVTFSGHTHGGQFGYTNPNYQWSPVKYAYREWAGLYREKHQSLYVNVGFGYLDYPSRVGILPEITLFHLKRKS